MINASTDRLFSRHGMTKITVGSIGEGLELKGSDLNIMLVPSRIEITEYIHQHLNDPDKIFFVLDTHNVKPGLARLRLAVNKDIHTFSMCQNFENQLYLSSELFKIHCLFELHPITNSPYFSNSDGNVDLQVCLHSKFWVSTAVEWITRNKNNEWPSPEVKQRIIDHGVMCVPVGKSDDINKDLIWRISFSVGEKFLCYSFTYTQLVCYALLKMYLKDVINPFTGHNNLLCSYFIKTVFFWICEESPVSMWKPDNLIPCVMKCIKRLVYCVHYSVCPNYFIPDINLFENRIYGHERNMLLKGLHNLIEYGWRSVFFLPQLSKVQLPTKKKINQINSDYFVESLEKITQSKSFNIFPDFTNYKKQFQIILSSKSKKTKSVILHNLLKQCDEIAETRLHMSCGNKFQYKQNKQHTCYLLQRTQYDCVSGWLMLATHFYQNEQCDIALFILSYVGRKFTPGNLTPGSNLSRLQREYSIPTYLGT